MNPLKLLNKQKSIQKHNFYFHKNPNRCAIFLDGLCKKGAANELQPLFYGSPFALGKFTFRARAYCVSAEPP